MIKVTVIISVAFTAMISFIYSAAIIVHVTLMWKTKQNEKSLS